MVKAEALLTITLARTHAYAHILVVEVHSKVRWNEVFEESGEKFFWIWRRDKTKHARAHVPYLYILYTGFTAAVIFREEIWDVMSSTKHQFNIGPTSNHRGGNIYRNHSLSSPLSLSHTQIQSLSLSVYILFFSETVMDNILDWMPEKHSQCSLWATAHEGEGIFADLVNVELMPEQTYSMGLCFARRKKKFLVNCCPVSPASVPTSFGVCGYKPRSGGDIVAFLCIICMKLI
jgi:hypothetical protein